MFEIYIYQIKPKSKNIMKFLMLPVIWKINLLWLTVYVINIKSMRRLKWVNDKRTAFQNYENDIR